jgi:transposase
MKGILFVLSTGSQWNALDATGICSCSSAYRRFREWLATGVFHEFWRRGLLAYDETAGIDWTWLSMDGVMTKAPLGGEKNRTKPNRSRQGRDETEPSYRWGRRASRPHNRRRELQRPQAPGGDLLRNVALGVRHYRLARLGPIEIGSKRHPFQGVAPSRSGVSTTAWEIRKTAKR